ncbi:MAG: penicillin-binding protein 2 [bacterium]|nr:penicillin-binding protein 2 [bacterium]
MSVFDPIDIAPEVSQATPPERSEFIGRAASQRRVAIAFASLFVVATFLLIRGVDVQLVHGRALATAAARNRTRSEFIIPTRGVIEDRSGVPLVRNVPRYTLGIVPADLATGPAEATAYEDAAHAIGIDVATLHATLQQYPRHLADAVPVRSDLSYEDAVRALVGQRVSPAVRLLVDATRDYRGSDGRDLESLSHVLGYIGRVSAAEYTTLASRRYRASDTVGKTGIEAAFEMQLRGTPGLRTVTIDARGRVVATSAAEPAAAGSNVRITVDRVLQERADSALRSGLRVAGGRRGAVVVIDSTTGDVLALVSLPAFSNTAFARGVSTSEYRALSESADHPLFPRAIAGTYPSGSTIKPFVAAAALSEGIITARTRIVSSGGIRVGASFFPDWRAGGHGSVDVTDALAQSVNTFFYVIGGGWPRAATPRGGPSQEDALGPARIANAFRAFGFGAPSGIDIPGEVDGLVPTPAWKSEARGEEWYIGDTYHLAIGQGDLLVTPLQLAAATAAIANGGRRVTPRLVAGSGGIGERIVGVTDVAVAAVRAGMRVAVTSGSAGRLADLPFFVAGKTGTAQTTANRRPHAWFTGFAESRDRSVTVTVLVEDGGEGSATAVPIAREVFAAWQTR